jgi:predicted nucleic acid-binding protein
MTTAHERSPGVVSTRASVPSCTRMDSATARVGPLGVAGIAASDLFCRHRAHQLAQRFEAISVDEAVSEAWALLVSRLRAARQKVPINGSWIAATAIVHRIPIVTQDSDHDAMPDVQVIRI